VDQERRALDLLDVVETGDADVAIREGLGGSLDFGEDFIGVLAAVHRELPHDPVAVVVVARVDGGVHARPAVAVSVGVGLVFELDARSPAVVEQVLDLLGDFGIGERRQEGEGLEHPNRGESKGEEERDIGQSSRSRKIDSSHWSHPSTEREATQGHNSLSERFFQGRGGFFNTCVCAISAWTNRGCRSHWENPYMG